MTPFKKKQRDDLDRQYNATIEAWNNPANIENRGVLSEQLNHITNQRLQLAETWNDLAGTDNDHAPRESALKNV